MIISRTPFRISLFGGGTDFPAWYQQHGGAVLSSTIDKYCYISCRHLPPFFEHKYRIVYSILETVRKIEEIKHPAIRETLRFLENNVGLEIHHDGDLPARSGMGSSSAFIVGLLNALKALQGDYLTKQELAETSIHIEQSMIKEAVGSQDQITCTHGGLNRIEFKPDGGFIVEPLILPKERKTELENSLMLFFTGISRASSEISRQQVSNLGNKTAELHAVKQSTDEACALLQSSSTDLTDLGALLHESWKLKRSLCDSISNSEIDEIYDAGREAGALGGKILGAGGGGFFLFMVKPENQAQVKERLKRLLHVSFKLEDTGSRIVLYNP